MRRVSFTLAVFVALMTSMRGQPPAMPWTLVEHLVASDLRGAYDVVATDINKDGRTDLLAVASGMPDLVWFENPLSAEAAGAKANAWTRRVIGSGLGFPINAAAADLDKDGIPEIAVASGFSTTPAKSTGILTLFTHGADINAPWTAKEFDRTPAAHRLRFIDADGTGRPLLVNAPLGGVNGVAPDYKDTVSIYVYAAPEMKRETVTDVEEGVIHGVFVTDWDGKGRQALLSASFLGVHLHRFANGKWSRTRLVQGSAEPWPNNGAGDVTVLRTRAGRQLATIEPFHGNQQPWRGNEVVIYRGKGETWTDRTVIDTTLSYGHTIVAADLDGDGTDEVVAGYRGKPNGINVYRLGSDNQWSKFVLESNAMPGSGCVTADFNNDKRVDLACTGGTSLKWYENQRGR